MNKKVRGNFRVFTPCEFIAAITQHPPTLKLRRTGIPEGWLARRSLAGEDGYSNKMRGQRALTAHTGDGSEAEEGQDIIDIAEHQPRRIPSRKWRELINPPSREASAGLAKGVGGRSAALPPLRRGDAHRGPHR